METNKTKISTTHNALGRVPVVASERNRIMSDAVLLRTIARSASNISEEARAQLLAISEDLPAPQEYAAVAEQARALQKANDQAEYFERLWYLRGDEIERLTELLRRVVDRDWTYIGKDSDGSNSESLYSVVQNARAYLASQPPTESAS